MSKKKAEGGESPASKQRKVAQERVEDMHLRLSEKYQAYKDLADRCLVNTAFIGNRIVDRNSF